MNIAYDDEILERFIPIAFDELLERLIEDFNIEKYQSQQLASSLRSFYHSRFHNDLLSLKNLYLPFNPDADTLTLKTYTDEEYKHIKSELISQIRPLLNSANYEELTEELLTESMGKTSPYGVDVSVDFNDFDDISIFFRGEAHRYDEKRQWKTLFLKKEKLRIDIYRRLFILLKPKTLDQRAKEIAEKEGRAFEKVKRQLKKSNNLLLDGPKSERIFMKLFKDIPHEDLEMLFPNTKVKMSFPDKVKIGVTGGGGTAGGVATLISKIGIVIDPVSLIIAVGTFGGVLWRQIKNVFTHRTRYMAKLAKNLYFYNLDNNAGVLTYMIDMAEAEESKEALLAYLFLLSNANAVSRDQLDKQIETYILETYKIPMDFEVDDGIKKLLILGVVEESEGMFKALELEKAILRLKTVLSKQLDI